MTSSNDRILPAYYPVDTKRVLMVTSALACGGSERQMLALCDGLVRRGYQVEIFEFAGVHSGQYSFESEFADLGIKSHRASEFLDVTRHDSERADIHGLTRFNPLLEYWNVAGLGHALDQAMQTFRPQVVHCWSDISNVIGGLVGTALQAPRIILGHRNLPACRMNVPGLALYHQAYRELLLNANVVQISNSVINAREYEAWLNVGKPMVKIVHNGFLPRSVDIRRGSEAAQCRQKYGLPTAVPVVGAVMRFAPEKNPTLWLDTAMKIAAARPDVHFILAGYGNLADQLTRTISEFGLSERFALPGPTKDVGSIYAAMDVFLMTSMFEGMPNVLIEAQAAGLPVVAPRLGGIGETVWASVTALLVENCKADQLAYACLRILNDSRWRQRTAVIGPALVSKRFHVDRMVDETIALYRPWEASLFGHLLPRLWLRIVRFLEPLKFGCCIIRFAVLRPFAAAMCFLGLKAREHEPDQEAP